MRVVPQDLTVLARARLRLVSVNDQVLWPSVGNLRHEGVLQARWETSATSASQARVLDLLNDPVLAHLNDVLGLVPVAALHGRLDPGILVLVHVGEDAVLIGQVPVRAVPHGYCRHRQHLSACRTRVD